MRFSFLLVLISALLTLEMSAAPTRFDMRDVGQRNVIHFVSDAQVEKTIGISNAVSGWLQLDPENIEAGVKGEFDVDVRTFHTGVELRNEQIKEKFFVSSEHPIATFVISKLLNTSKPKLGEGQPVSLRVEGQLKARGIAKPQTILVKLVYFRESELTRQRLTGNLVKMSASLDVDTALYGITIPDTQRSRYARFIQVYVDAVGTDRAPVNARGEESPKPK